MPKKRVEGDRRPRPGCGRTARPKKDGRGMSEMPFGPPVNLHQLSRIDADDLAEAEGDDGEIVAAQAQHREAEQHAERAPRAARPAAGTPRS